MNFIRFSELSLVDFLINYTLDSNQIWLILSVKAVLTGIQVPVAGYGISGHINFRSTQWVGVAIATPQ